MIDTNNDGIDDRDLNNDGIDDRLQANAQPIASAIPTVDSAIVWEEEVTPAGQYYYYNIQTAESTWNRPAPGQGLIDPCPNPSAPPQPDFVDYSAQLGPGYSLPTAAAFALPVAVGGSVPVQSFDKEIAGKSNIEVIYPTTAGVAAVAAGSAAAPQISSNPVPPSKWKREWEKLRRPVPMSELSEGCRGLFFFLCCSLVVCIIGGVCLYPVSQDENH